MGTATNVIMPVLGMSQDSGKLVHWFKKAGERIEKGEPLMEVETDKATVEIESPASGILTKITAQEGDEVPVTQVVAVIQDGEDEVTPPTMSSSIVQNVPADIVSSSISISPLAARMAAEHHLDVAQIKPSGGRIEKADVLAHLENVNKMLSSTVGSPAIGKRVLASPKARRLAEERRIDIANLSGSGPDHAVLADDLPIQQMGSLLKDPKAAVSTPATAFPPNENEMPMSAAWSRMVDRLSSSWQTTPHFYLMREVNATNLMSWREKVQAQTGAKITYTDLMVKLVAMALRRHPQVNAHYLSGKLLLPADVNIGMAVATEDGLLVPVIHRADTLGLSEISAVRIDLVDRGRAGKLRLEDMQGGTFTISNLGMYDVDAFNAMVNPGQAAILAVGRIAERVVAVNGQAVVQPMMVISISFDHRVVDGARGAQFLQTLATWIENPLAILN
jgi:pyruvate dehydrogenase E2 component (dihydrolipoamide acetyltransferase)